MNDFDRDHKKTKIHHTVQCSSIAHQTPATMHQVGIPGLGLAVAEPMAVDAITFQQGGREGLPSPVTIRLDTSRRKAKRDRINDPTITKFEWQ